MMKTNYKIQLIQQGNIESITLPEELNLDTTEVIIRQEGEKIIIEPLKEKSLLETLATLEDIEKYFSDVDEGLLLLNNIDL